MFWAIFKRTLKVVFLLSIWVRDMREVIACSEKRKTRLCTQKSDVIENEYFFQVQNLVAMAPFYLPMNALLPFDLLQRLHNDTTALQNLLVISKWKYIEI